ncbi:MAG: glycosyltransferase, partial [Rudaea sp.]
MIVAADSGDGLIDCVASVLANGAGIEIVVVDNDSRDDSIERLEARFAGNESVRVLRNGANLGFGSGCNRGAAIAAGDVLLFLNPDCHVEATALPRLRRILDNDPRIGVVGVLQVDAHGLVDPASRRHDPLLARALAA